jgi:uncharacterized membrane protein
MSVPIIISAVILFYVQKMNIKTNNISKVTKKAFVKRVSLHSMYAFPALLNN